MRMANRYMEKYCIETDDENHNINDSNRYNKIKIVPKIFYHKNN